MIFPALKSKQIYLGARLLLTALVVGYVLRAVDGTKLLETLRQINLAPLLAALALQGCAIAVAVVRWQKLLAEQTVNLTWLRTARLSLVGLFFNLFFLGALGGDAAKFIGILPHAPERKGLLVLSLVQDRLMGLAGLFLLLTGLIGIQWPLLWHEPATRRLALALPAACVMFFGGVAVIRTLHSSRPSDPRSGNSLFGLARSVFPGAAFRLTLILSVAVHALVIAAGYLAARSVGITLPFSATGVVLGVTSLALSLPITIAGLGVREGVLIWLLGLFGVGNVDLVLGLSVCLLSINLFWAFVGGVAFYWPTPKARTPATLSG